MFAWSMLVAGAMWLLTLPVLVGVLALMYVDHRHGRLTFGENAGMYGRIVWAFRHPQVYAFAVPVLGIAGDVLAVTARTRQAFRGVAMGAIAAFGAFGFGAFVQLSVYADAVKQPAYIGMSLFAVVPVLLLLALWADLFRRGKFSFTAPALFAVACGADAAGGRDRGRSRRDPGAEGRQHRVGSCGDPLRHPVGADRRARRTVLVGNQGHRPTGQPGARRASRRSVSCSARSCSPSRTSSRRCSTPTRSPRRKACSRRSPRRRSSAGP